MQPNVGGYFEADGFCFAVVPTVKFRRLTLYVATWCIRTGSKDGATLAFIWFPQSHQFRPFRRQLASRATEANWE